MRSIKDAASFFVEKITEHQLKQGLTPLYSLSEVEDKEGCPSLYKTFISCADEYEFAEKAFGSVAILNKLKDMDWFMTNSRLATDFRGYEAWLEDMKLRDASAAKKTLLLKVSEGDVSAARKLYDISLPKNKNTKGRPKKEDILREARSKAETNKDVEEDLKRLNVVKMFD